jgi:hypothetical protein
MLDGGRDARKVTVKSLSSEKAVVNLEERKSFLEEEFVGELVELSLEEVLCTRVGGKECGGPTIILYKDRGKVLLGNKVSKSCPEA